MSRLFTILTVAGLVVLLAVPVVVGAVGPEECYPRYQTTRYSYAITVPDNYAYMGEGLCVAVVDVTDPTRPRVPGRAPAVTTRGEAASLSTVGTSLYLAGYDADVVVIDISDPLLIHEVSNVEHLGDLGATSVLGRYLYAGGSSLHVLDLSAPLSPRVINSLWDLASWNMAISNHRLYLASSLLTVMSLTSPATPTAITNYNLGQSANDIFVLDNRAYIPYGFTHRYGTFGGLLIVDVSDPGNPTNIGDYDAGEPVHSVVVSNDLAYMVTDSKLSVVDVSASSSPAEIGSLGFSFPIYDLDLAGFHVFIVGSYGLRVIDVSDPTNPVLAGVYNTSADVNGDGQVNVVDVQIAASLFGQETGSSDTQMSDVDGNGYIDVKDLSLIASHWRVSP